MDIFLQFVDWFTFLFDHFLLFEIKSILQKSSLASMIFFQSWKLHN